MDSFQLTESGLSREEFKQYLREVCYYEKNLFLINLSIERLSVQMSGLGTCGYVQKPLKGTIDSKGKVFNALITTIFMAFIPILIISLLIVFYSDIIWVGVVAFIMLYGIWYAFVFWILDSERKRKNREIQIRNDRVQADYEEAVRKEDRRLEIENLQKQVLACDISNFEIDRDICSRTLEDLYACNILHSKYRNFVAVASFYDYFDTGRCTSLEGRSGAYATYELESRLDKIISRLDQVLSELERIKQNQLMLYSEIRDAREQANLLTFEILRGIDRIAESTDVQMYQLAENQRLIEYNTRIAAESSETLKHIVLYKERVGGSLPYIYPKFDR